MRFKEVRNRVLGIAALSATLVALAVPAAASAGEMKQWVCRTPDGALTGTTDGWTFDNSVPGAVVYSNCSTENGATGMRMDANSMYDAGANQGVMWWRYRTPDAVSIAQVYLFVDGITRGDASRGGTLSMTFTQGGPFYSPNSILQTCDQWQGCDRWLQWIHHVPAPDTGSWYAMWFCGGPQGGVCPGGFRGGMTLSHGFVVLRDTFDPVASNATGAAATQTTLRGTANLAFSAGDMGVGVSDVEVKIGGVAVLPRQVIDTNNNRCVPNSGGYLYSQPCKKSLQANLNIDTTKAPEGTQTLTATIWDASGNAATVLNRQVTIDNKLPPRLQPGGSTAGPAQRPAITGDSSVGAKLTATTGLWVEAALFARQWQISDDGSTVWKPIPGADGETLTPEPWMVDKFVRVAVTATNPEGSTTEFSAARRVEPSNSGGGGVVPKPAPTTADELVPDNGSGGDPATGQLVPSRKRKSARVDYGDSVRIEGRVLDGAGRPVVDAQVDVFELIGVKGAVRRKVASVKTDAKGGYSYKPAAHSNRVVELQYSRQRGASIYQSTHALKLTVRAGVTLRAERTRIPSFGTVTLRGRVLASDLPKSGIKLQMRAIDGKRELKIGNPRANAKGEFTWKWKFSELRHATVPFYVRILRTGDLPALTNKSRVVRVRVG